MIFTQLIQPTANTLFSKSIKLLQVEFIFLFAIVFNPNQSFAAAFLS